MFSSLWWSFFLNLVVHILQELGAFLPPPPPPPTYKPSAQGFVDFYPPPYQPPNVWGPPPPGPSTWSPVVIKLPSTPQDELKRELLDAILLPVPLLPVIIIFFF